MWITRGLCWWYVFVLYSRFLYESVVSSGNVDVDVLACNVMGMTTKGM